MSSGTLPLGTYHRASALGSGTYGSVVQVYDDDGNEYALKLFEQEEEESEGEEEYDSDSSGEENNIYSTSAKALDLGALREISILRLLRHENSHPNIISIHDVKQPGGICEEEEEDQVDASMLLPGITMKLFRHGTLSKALSQHLDKRSKVRIAHGILSGVAYLHQNGIIHRDIKSDNIMIDIDNDGNYNPVIIDFSLSKMIVPECVYGMHRNASSEDFYLGTSLQGEDTHTPSVGTPTYRAPECVSGQAYGLPSDMYSVGIVLLELIRGGCIESFKDKGAAKIVENELGALPHQPFANMIRGLLEKDPTKRLTARGALKHELFLKFGLENEWKNQQLSLRTVDIQRALPLEHYDELERFLESKNGKKRKQLIQNIAKDLDSSNPWTVQAALCYSLQLSQLDDCIDDLSASQGLIDCVVLGHKFFEKELWNLKEIEKLERGIFRKCSWSAADYVDTEGTLWMLMDYCLYPRKFIAL